MSESGKYSTQYTEPVELPDIVVVIDVLRAFSTAHQLFLLGAERIILAESINEAFELRKRFAGAFLLGERKGYPIAGFDFGNSPLELEGQDLQGKTIIQTTSNGVPALLSAKGRIVLAGAFCNAPQLIRYLHLSWKEGKRIEFVSSDPKGPDDISVCLFLETCLPLGRLADPESCQRAVRESPTAHKFIDSSQQEFSSLDLEWCLCYQPGNFILKLSRNSEIPMLLAQKMEELHD